MAEATASAYPGDIGEAYGAPVRELAAKPRERMHRGAGRQAERRRRFTG